MPNARARLDADDEHHERADDGEDDLRLDDGSRTRRRAAPPRPEGQRRAEQRGTGSAMIARATIAACDSRMSGT